MGATFNTLRWETNQGVGVLTLNRPDSLNAINSQMVAELGEAISLMEEDDSVRSVIITGSGRAFSAGADLGEWDPDGGNDETWVPKMHAIMSRLYWLTKPVVAAVNGAAMGAGCDMALVADIRVSSSAARFGEAYVNIGFAPDCGGSFLLPRIVGESRAAEMIYTGRIIGSEESERIGLSSKVVSVDALTSEVRELAERLAKGPTRAIGLAKQGIRSAHTNTFEESLRFERISGAICDSSEDNKEALRAYSENREPEFEGR